MKQILLSMVLLSVSVSVMAKEYTLGIVPQQSPIKLFKSWKPVADYLSGATGFRIILKTEKSIADFEKVLYAGGYDLSYMNPFHYTQANQRQHYQAVVRADKNIRGILVMRDDQSDFETLIKDPNTRFLFPSPNAFAATLLIKYELLTEFSVNLNRAQNFQYVNSHDSVYKGVARGVGQLGGGIQRTFNNFKGSADKLRIHEVYTTKAYPSHPIALNPEIPEADQALLVKALLKLPEALLAGLSIKKVVPSHDDEFAVIRALSAKLDIVARD